MIQRWKNYPFQSASYITDEFKSFVKDLKKYILSRVLGSELINGVGAFRSLWIH